VREHEDKERIRMEVQHRDVRVPPQA
jgi:hypothetical protein